MKSLPKVFKWVEILPQRVQVGDWSDHQGSSAGRVNITETISIPGESEEWEREIEHKKHLVMCETQRIKERILEQARQEAESLLVNARKESTVVREQARQEGRASGIQEGKSQVIGEWERTIALFEQWFQEIKNSRNQLLETVKEPLMELSVHIAEKIIQREAEQNPFVMTMVERALEKLSHRERVVVRVNPMEYVLVRELRDDLLARVDGIDTLEIREDKRIEAGGCLVETAFGSVDARVKDQLEIIRETLIDAIRDM